MNPAIKDKTFSTSLPILLKRFAALNAVKFGDFTLKAGGKSYYYLDCRLVSLDAIGADFISHMFTISIEEQLNTLFADPYSSPLYIGATGVGGAPLVGSLIVSSRIFGHNWQGFIVRDAEKEHGTKKRIEGHIGLENNSGHVVLLEDVVTSGGSIIEAAKAVRALGINPIGVHCIIDREEGARKALEKEGLPLFSLLELADVLALEQKDKEVV